MTGEKGADAGGARRGARGKLLTRARLQFAAVLVLLVLAQTALPGGLTPRRALPQRHRSRATEVLDVFSETSPDELAGTPRTIDEVHGLGLAHRGSWMFLVDDRLRLLLLWRAPTMATCGSSWSVCGEHAVAGESFEQAARRGLREEVPFLGEAHLSQLGTPFMYNHSYDDSAARVDKQWTRSYVATSALFSVDFSLILSGDAVAIPASGSQSAARNASSVAAASAGDMPPELIENLHFQGMPIVDVVRTLTRSAKYFCNDTQRMWMLRSISLLARALRVQRPSRFKTHLAKGWTELESEGLPICCAMSEESKALKDVDLKQCGLPCTDR